MHVLGVEPKADLEDMLPLESPSDSCNSVALLPLLYHVSGSTLLQLPRLWNLLQTSLVCICSTSVLWPTITAISEQGVSEVPYFVTSSGWQSQINCDKRRPLI